MIKPSNRKGKKMMLVLGDKTIHFCSDVSTTYVEGATDKKKRHISNVILF